MTFNCSVSYKKLSETHILRMLHDLVCASTVRLSTLMMTHAGISRYVVPSTKCITVLLPEFKARQLIKHNECTYTV